MEKEPEFEEGYVAITVNAPHYWSRLGSAKSQSSEQQRQGKELVLDMTMEAPEWWGMKAPAEPSCIKDPAEPGF